MLEVRVELFFSSGALGTLCRLPDCFLDESLAQPSNIFFTLCIQLYVPKAVPNGVQMFLRLNCYTDQAGEGTTENFRRNEGKSWHS